MNSSQHDVDSHLTLVQGRRRGASQATVAQLTPQRAPLGTPLRVTSNSPFSHIQIIPKAPSEVASSIGTNSPEPIFRKLSFSQEAESEMADSHRLSTSGSTASLANMTSGTTFAAKARAAELNAVRARRALRDTDSEDDVPSTRPVSLGALKFTKPRHRGRAWKALNLNDLPENPYDSDDQAGSSGNPYESILSPETEKLEQMVRDYDASEWDPEMPSGADTDGHNHPQKQNHTAISAPFSNLATTHPASATMTDQEVEHDRYPCQKGEPEVQQFHPNATVVHRVPTFENVKPAVSAVLTARPQGRELSTMGHDAYTRSAAEKVRGSMASTVGLQPSVPVTANISKAVNVKLPTPNLYNSQYGYNSALRAQRKLPTVKGTMDHQYRFPTSSMASKTDVIPQIAQSHRWPDPANVAKIKEHAQQYSKQHLQSQQTSSSTDHGLQPSLQTAIYQGEPTPYGGIPASSKREMLLRNLAETVAASNMSSGTRTVLYDPVAQGNHISTIVSPTKPSETEFESLGTGDPLPWKDRPVNIHNGVGLMTQDYQHAITNQYRLDPSPALSYGLDPSLVMPKPKTHTERLDDVEKWFHKDNRGQNEVREYLNKAADRHYAAQKSEADLRKEGPTDNRAADLNPTLTIYDPIASDVISRLLIPVLGNLQSYLAGPVENSANHFGRFARVPEWCIDKGKGGELSFFGEDWGQPPMRVGRDPRYMPVLHEGRYTVFEDMGGLRGRGGMARFR